jgi:hypothetical protein
VDDLVLQRLCYGWIGSQSHGRASLSPSLWESESESESERERAKTKNY